MAATEATPIADAILDTLREGGYVVVNAAKVERQEAALAEIAAEHRPVIVYPGLSDAMEVCRACCCAGHDEFRSGVCADTHDHGPGKPICATVAILERAKVGGRE